MKFASRPASPTTFCDVTVNPATGTCAAVSAVQLSVATLPLPTAPPQ